MLAKNTTPAEATDPKSAASTRINPIVNLHFIFVTFFA